ncbi:MAG: flavoprotein [Actinomycetota bacterium]
MARILLGITGSVAAVKAPELFGALTSAGHEVKVVATAAARHFVDEAQFTVPEPLRDEAALIVRGQTTFYYDADEWPSDRLFTIGEPVLHIELRRWAELLLIAPLDANTLAKLSLGLCDNLLTCLYRAWDLQRTVIVAPAMNTYMWEHPATERHLRQLATDFGGAQPHSHLDASAILSAINETCDHLRIVPPVSKRLACGDEGMGGMATVEQILDAVRASAPH